MNRITYILLVVLLTIVPCASQSKLPNAKLHSLVLQGIDLTWQEKYSHADSVFQRVIREFPGHPAGYLYQAGVVLARAMDNEMEVDLAKFDSLVDIGRRKAKGMIESGSDRTWGNFFVGTADGSDSYARVYRGDWFGGTRKGFSSVSSFKDAVKLDSTLCDAYAGIGAFYYWRSRKTEFFNWIPFVGDDRSEAFTLLTKSIEKGTYNRFTALGMLVAIYTDAGMFEKAVTCSREGLKNYPRNRGFLWGLATAFHKAEKWTDAAGAYQQLLDAIMESQDNNHYNEIVCRLNLAKVKTEMHDSSGIANLLKDITKFQESDFPNHLQSRAKNKLEQAEEMLLTSARSQTQTGKQRPHP
ncbi:MAG: tetratricopeptide repeat protein [Ignavibacteriales bacterium]|nr:tetratricopeptide repeat protein [Ignavibacteriales bacterium]